MTNEYNKDYYSTLKVKFDGSEKIERNYSQALQDMFVLSLYRNVMGVVDRIEACNVLIAG